VLYDSLMRGSRPSYEVVVTLLRPSKWFNFCCNRVVSPVNPQIGQINGVAIHLGRGQTLVSPRRAAVLRMRPVCPTFGCGV